MQNHSILLLASPIFFLSTAGWSADSASVIAESKAPPIVFAAEGIRSALQQAHWVIGGGDSNPSLSIEWREPDGRGEDESSAITAGDARGTVHLQIRGKDVRGVLYGGLDVAEQIVLAQGPVKIEPRQGRPCLLVSGLKFNIPLAGNDYLAKEDLEKGGWFWDLEYWRTFMRFLACHRYKELDHNMKRWTAGLSTASPSITSASAAPLPRFFCDWAAAPGRSERMVPCRRLRGSTM